MINLTNFTLILRHLYLVELTLNTKNVMGFPQGWEESPLWR